MYEKSRIPTGGRTGSEQNRSVYETPDEQAQKICSSLGGRKNRDGSYHVHCPAHADSTPSLHVTPREKLLIHCLAGCPQESVIRALRNRDLWPNNKDSPQTKTNGSEILPWINAKGDMYSRDTIKKYFRTRAIHLDGEVLSFPPCLRFGSYHDQKTGEQVNQIVAAATNLADQSVKAVQRLFLDLETNQKTGDKMLGPTRGRGVWFYKDKPKKELIIGEGIETTLSGIHARGMNGVATLTISGMKNIRLPEETEVVYILADSDPAPQEEAKEGYSGQRAAIDLAARLEKEGKTVYLVSPDATCFTDNPAKLDFNDLLKEDPSGRSIQYRFEQAIPLQDLGWNPPQHENKGSGHDDDAGFPAETLQALHEMNRKYAAVLLSGRFRVIREMYDQVESRHSIEFLEISSVHNFFANQKVLVPAGENQMTYKPISKVWMSWPERRTYDSVVFDPGGRNPDNFFNLWRGFARTPEKGDWSLMQHHIAHIICGGSPELYNYVISWLARIIQDPGGERPGVAIVLKGKKGTGKGVFVDSFGKIFGEAFIPISTRKGFTGNFNMHLSKCLLAYLDEATWGGNKQDEGQLKTLITEDTLLFEPKGIDSLTLKNNLNVIISSNEDWVIPATEDERRFLVLNVDDSIMQDAEYFQALDRQMYQEGGIEAMMYDLAHWEYSLSTLRNAPKTEGLAEQVEQTMDIVMCFWRDVLTRGYLLTDKETGAPIGAMEGRDDNEWPEMAWKHEILYEFQKKYAWKQKYVPGETRFWTKTYEWWPAGIKAKGRAPVPNKDGKRPPSIELPPLTEMRRMFTDYTGIKFENEDGDDLLDEPWNNQF